MPPPVEREQTVSEYLAAAMADAPQRARQRLIKFHRVLVNGVPAEGPGAMVRPGDAVTIQEPRAERAASETPASERPAPPPKAPQRPRPEHRRPNEARAGQRPAGPMRERREARSDRAPRPARPARGERGDRGERERWLRGGIRIVHEDDDLIVVDKPSGMVTASPTPIREPTVFDILKDHIGRSGAMRPRGRRRMDDRRPAERQRVWVIHRLDKEASGLLVFAKSPRAFETLKEELRHKRIHRLYAALVEGAIGEPGASGTIQSFLKEDHSGRVHSLDPSAFRGPPSPPPPHPPHSPHPARDSRGGRPGAAPAGARGHDEPAKLAVTHYRVLGAGAGVTLAQVRLETGRKHQIRVHFADRGHPLVGDRRYGATSDPLHRLGLHATELGLTHPATGQSLRFTSPAPTAFYRAVAMEPPAPSVEAAARDQGRSAPPRAGARTDWDEVADWYDELLSGRGSDHYERVILPGTLRLLRPAAGMNVLDVASGQGILGRRLSEQGVNVTGIESSERLVEAARARAAEAAATGQTRYLVGDARDLAALDLHGFDAAACVMALSNIDPLEPVIRGIASALRPGGVLVAVVSHPAFRAPGQTSWDWDARGGTQYRRVDGYLSPGQTPIEMHPGKRARGEGGATTWTFHRPIQTYVRTLAEAGLLVDALEEWPGQRESTSGPRAAEENRARREIPLFLAIRAVKTA